MRTASRKERYNKEWKNCCRPQCNWVVRSASLLSLFLYAQCKILSMPTNITCYSACRWFIQQMLNCKRMIRQTYATSPSQTQTPAVWETLSSTSVFVKLPGAQDYFLYILFTIKSVLSTYKLTMDISTATYTSGKSKMCHCLEDIFRRLVIQFKKNQQ